MSITFYGRHEKTNYWVKDVAKPFTFPAGEAHLKFLGEDLKGYTEFVVDVRGHNPQDIFHLLMFMDAVGQAGSNDVTLFLPYIPAARADRGVPFGARVYAQALSQYLFTNIIVLDPHSPVAVDQLVYEGQSVTEFPFERIIRHEIQDPAQDTEELSYVGVIAPDKGAVSRASRAAKVMGVPVYRAEKSRDFKTGQLTGFHMLDELPAYGKLLLVDDICDGGGTFVGLADAIGLGRDRLDLWVSHGIFSKGFDALEDRFGTIHTTDSYFVPTTWSKLADCTIEVHKIAPYLWGEV